MPFDFIGVNVPSYLNPNQLLDRMDGELEALRHALDEWGERIYRRGEAAAQLATPTAPQQQAIPRMLRLKADALLDPIRAWCESRFSFARPTLDAVLPEVRDRIMSFGDDMFDRGLQLGRTQSLGSGTNRRPREEYVPPAFVSFNDSILPGMYAFHAVLQICKYVDGGEPAIRVSTADADSPTLEIYETVEKRDAEYDRVRELLMNSSATATYRSLLLARSVGFPSTSRRGGRSRRYSSITRRCSSGPGSGTCRNGRGRCLRD